VHPHLFSIGSVSIQSYGFFFALAYGTAFFLLGKAGGNAGYNKQHFTDLALYCLISGVFGARLLFVVSNWNYFSTVWWEIFYFWSGGLVFFGGFVIATLFLLAYFRLRKIPLLRGLDICVPALAAAHGVGRLGCFFAGCCHGASCDLPWGVVMNSSLVDESVRGTPIHPTQLYEFFALMAIAWLSWKLLHKKDDQAGTQSGNQFAYKPGYVSSFYLMAYPLTRFVLEFFRGDSIRGSLPLWNLSTSQGISVILFLFGCGLFVRSFRSNH